MDLNMFQILGTDLQLSIDLLFETDGDRSGLTLKTTVMMNSGGQAAR